MAAPVPSLQTIRATFPDLADDKVRELRRAMESGTDGNNRDVVQALDYANDLLDQHGRESMQSVDGDYVMYTNSGDPYRPCVMFDERTGLFKVGCWGDYVESWEKRGRRFK